VELASGNHVGYRDLVFLPVLLFRVLRHRTLRRSELPIFGAVVIFWISDFETAALGRGFCFSFRRRSLLSEVELHAEVAAVAPTAVELKSAALVIHKGEPQTFVLADSPIPAAIWIRNFVGKTSDACKWLVTDADDVVVEVVKRVAHVPHELSAAFALSISGRWDRIVGIFEPPDRIRFLTGTELLARDVMENGRSFIC
jgi:hypothetical protein